MKWIRALLRSLPIVLGSFVLIALATLFLIRIERTVEASGEVQINRLQIVRPKVSGIVTEVLVEPGATVQAGQVLCRLVDYDFERQQLALRQQLNEALAQQLALRVRDHQVGREIQPLERARQEKDLTGNQLEMQLQSSRSRELELALKQAEESLARVGKLKDAGLASDQTYKEAEFNKLQAEQRWQQSLIEEKVENAQSARSRDDLALLGAQQRNALTDLSFQRGQSDTLVKQLTEQLDQYAKIAEQYTLRAEIGGVVVSDPVNELRGKKIQAGEQLFSVIDISAVHFVTYVPEESIVRVRTGQLAYVEVSGLPKRRFDVFTGEVRKVSESPQLQQAGQDILYPVEIWLRKPWVLLSDNRFFLRNGMRGTAKISYQHDVSLLVAIYESLSGQEDLPPSV